ncbi:acyl-CoA dehydrogenase family protein [Williamsia sp.]|uniref:acyl-CoA dehydrogenase family protein n=1 Tax=Williamsia sp. TaxID=1872085 RepID=UPI002F933FA1
MSSGAITRAIDIVSASDFRLPYPGEGDTSGRFRQLIELTRRDIAMGRMVEAHGDAAAILHELGGPAVGPGELWGVWAAEPPAPLVTANLNSGVWTLTGTKVWCSGASGCTHALVTARTDGGRRLFAVDLRKSGVHPSASQWSNRGMSDTNTAAVEFVDVEAQPVGQPGRYLNRPGFWHGGVGVAACWFGGTVKVAQALSSKARSDSDDITLMHLGAVDALLATGRAELDQAAADIDRNPEDLAVARRRAYRVRWSIEQIAGGVLDRVARALGPAPLVGDPDHAQAVADLSVYVRQSHADRDLVELGRLAAENAR